MKLLSANMVAEKDKLLIRVFNTSLPTVKLGKTVTILSTKWPPLGDHRYFSQKYFQFLSKQS